MGIFDFMKKKDDASFCFEEIVSIEMAEKLAKKGVLKPLYLMPLRFGGAESKMNCLYVTPEIVQLKDRYDDMVEELVDAGKVDGYSCSPEYKGNSFIPSKLTIVAKMSGEPVFTETINVW